MENTKTDGISSGLVARLHLAFSDDGENIRFWTTNQAHANEWAGENWETEEFVRLSDAEAIISDLQNLVVAENQRKQQLEQEVAQMKSDLDEEAHIRDRMAQLLAETAVALKGPEKALHRHGWQDLPEVAAKQSAALKLARDALGEAMGWNWLDDDCPSNVRKKVIEALAAIDALKGERE